MKKGTQFMDEGKPLHIPRACYNVKYLLKTPLQLMEILQSYLRTTEKLVVNLLKSKNILKTHPQ